MYIYVHKYTYTYLYTYMYVYGEEREHTSIRDDILTDINVPYHSMPPTEHH
jgi:hypothetical protein